MEFSPYKSILDFVGVISLWPEQPLQAVMANSIAVTVLNHREAITGTHDVANLVTTGSMPDEQTTIAAENDGRAHHKARTNRKV